MSTLPAPVEVARIQKPGDLRIVLAYTERQMLEFGAKMRAQALDEAAAVCQEGADAIKAHALSVGAAASAERSPRMLAMLDCAEAIRALKGKA